MENRTSDKEREGIRKLVSVLNKVTGKFGHLSPIYKSTLGT